MGLCLTISEVDWSLTKDVLSIIGTFGVLVIGVSGLFTWRRQLRGTSEYELAKKVVFKLKKLSKPGVVVLKKSALKSYSGCGPKLWQEK